MSKEKQIQEYESKQLIDELSKMPPMVIATAYLHAINYTRYGVDVTEKWVTATEQVYALEKARNQGYSDALHDYDILQGKESCENWYDVPSDEMTLGQARQAVKDLRKMWAEHLEQEPCDDCISRQAAIDAIDTKAWEFCDYLIRNGRNDEQKPVSHFADNLRECVREELPPVNPQPKDRALDI